MRAGSGSPTGLPVSLTVSVSQLALLAYVPLRSTMPDQTQEASFGQGDTRSRALKVPSAPSVSSRAYVRAPQRGLCHVPARFAPASLAGALALEVALAPGSVTVAGPLVGSPWVPSPCAPAQPTVATTATTKSLRVCSLMAPS